MYGLSKSVAGISPDWHNSECLVSMLSGKMGLVWQDDGERTWSSHVVAECHEARGFHSPRVPCYVSMSAPHRMVASDASGARPDPELTRARTAWCCEPGQWRGIHGELHRILVFTFETQPCNDAIEVMCSVPVM